MNKLYTTLSAAARLLEMIFMSSQEKPYYDMRRRDKQIDFMFFPIVCIFSNLVHILFIERLTAVNLFRCVVAKERRMYMPRGQRKTIDEKITAKQELIEALMTRVESEQRELEELYQEKRHKELEAVSDLIEEAGLSPEEAASVLQQYIDSRDEVAS